MDENNGCYQNYLYEIRETFIEIIKKFTCIEIHLSLNYMVYKIHFSVHNETDK